jgi:RhtB (resistance to homoserine/threonine) family protein
MALLPFIVVSAIVIVAPGPDMALVGRNALFGGRRAAVFTAMGVTLGLTVWSVAASVGIAALLRRSEPAFLTLKIVGAVYLVWLGLQALHVAWKGDPDSTAPAATEGSGRHPLRALRQGFLSNLANPKIAVFFTSFLPQFAGADANVLALLALGLVFCLMTLVWMAAYGVFVAKVGDVLRRPRVRRAMEGVTGVVLIAFGARLATAHR